MPPPAPFCPHCGDAEPVGRVTLRSFDGEVERHPVCSEVRDLARSLGARGYWRSFDEVARGGTVVVEVRR